MKGDITTNFSWYEFRPKGAPKTWKPKTAYQKLLIRNQAKNLQVVRSEMPSGSWMKVTSGVRPFSDVARLRKLGYHPSATSDHFFGTAVPIKNAKKKKKFGDTYIFSVGATDIVSINYGVWDLFKLTIDLIKNHKCDFGQVIYEYNPNPKNKSEWVHYGADPTIAFSYEVIKLLGRKKFMTTRNGGKTYKIYRPR